MADVSGLAATIANSMQGVNAALAQLQGGGGAAPTAANVAANAAANPTGNTQADLTADQAAAVLAKLVGFEYKVGMPIDAGLGKTTIDSTITALVSQYGATQKKIGDLTMAAAKAYALTGQVDQPTMVKIQQFSGASDSMNQLAQKLQDNKKRAVDAWMQLR